MTPIEALKIALTKEEVSMKLNMEMGGRYPELKDLFSKLYDREYKHRKLVEDTITDLTKY